MDAESLCRELLSELTARLGPPREYQGNQWWSLSDQGGLDASLQLNRDGKKCELWVADSGQRQAPRLLAEVAARSDITAALQAVHHFRNEHPLAAGADLRAAARCERRLHFGFFT